MEDTLTFDTEEALVRGQIPLKNFREKLKQQDESKIKCINFSKNGYCNDAVLKLIKSEKKKKYENLTTVDLTGCILLSNAGVKWLADIVDGISSLEKIVLDGCTSLSDDDLSLLLKKVGPKCQVYMRGTSVSHLFRPEGRTVHVNKPSVLSSVKSLEEVKIGHALVVPHESMENSFVEYVQSKSTKKRLPFHHITDVELHDWTLTLSELSVNHPLLGSMISNSVTQVIIPFDESAEIKEVKSHVTDTIAKIITKASFTTEYLKNAKEKEEQVKIDLEVDDFITVQNVVKQHYNDGILGNYSYATELLGCFLSRTPLTRSNPYFEIEVVEVKAVDDGGKDVDPYDSDSEFGEVKAGVLIGVLFDKLFSCRNPLDVDVDKGGEVATFDFGRCKKAGFGITGDWLSEYVPSKTAKFFAVCNGVEDNKDLTTSKVTEELVYPLIACIGDRGNASKIKLSNVATPPKELTLKWEKENRWISRGYSENILVDNNGVMCNCSPIGDTGTFMSLESFETEACIKVLDNGNFGKIRIALSTEKESDKKESSEMLKTKSWIYQCVTGEVISEKKTNYIVSPKRVESGDILTVKLVTEEKEEKVVLYKNQQKIVETPFSPAKDNDMNIIKLYIGVDEPKAKVQLMNYRPKYRGPILFPESLTVGRLHSLKIYDDGTLIIPQKLSPYRAFGNFYGCFMAKSPMNLQCLSFEVVIGDLGSVKDAVSVGFCHSEIYKKTLGMEKLPTVFEISAGCIVLTSDGNVYAESQEPTLFKEEAQFKNDDKVKVEVEKSTSAEKLLFDEDGSLSPQQDVNIKFYVNNKMVYEYLMTIRSDGLFPTIFTQETVKEEFGIKILNFYAETEENRKKANLEQNRKKEKKKKIEEKVEKKKNEPCPNFRECEFIVVETGKTFGKLQLVEEQIKGDLFSKEMENINKSIEYYEKNLEFLDLHRQNVYSTLCEAKEKIESLVHSPNRIQYLSIDMTSGKGMDVLLNRMTDILDCRKLHHEVKYMVPKPCRDGLDTVLTTVKKNKLIEFDTGLVGFDEVTNKIEGQEFLQLAKILHEQGRVAMIQIGTKTVIADIEFLISVMENLGNMSSMQLCNKLTTAINESSHVWTTEEAVAHFSGKEGQSKKMISLLMKILQEYLGLIELPAWRLKPEDTQFLYTTLESLNPPPISLREFWSKEDNMKDFVVMQSTFSFIHSIPDNILAAILSSATRYGRTLLMTGYGAVFQIGCVQTVVAKHKGFLENDVISVESKCYIPDKKSGPVDELTEVYVKEYTWNIFCLYTDIIEKVLKERNIVYFDSGSVSHEFINVSVGCKHNWKQIPGKANQSICTMCNKCCGLGRKCQYNGIVGDNLRECPCKTQLPGCIDCGICMDCAAELWALRSYLRPLPITARVAEKKVADKLDGSSNEKSGHKKMTPEETNNAFENIPLDPVAFNEIEYQHFDGGNISLILKDVDDGSRISVFPGKATTLANDTDDLKISEKVKLLSSQTSEAKYKNKHGESIRLRITDPFKSMTKEEEKLDLAGIQESRVVYHACISREMTISHEAGLLCYNSASSSVPVAQFIGPRPFSEKLKKLTIKIINAGEKTNVGIGICPGKTYPANRMPGWNRWSIAYHADDGGIFIEAGFGNSHVVKCTTGDTMSLFCDVTSRQLVFYKNDQVVKEIKINVPRGGYWPMIGLHSIGECVKILDKECWTPEPEDIPPKPDAFSTYKYGNLWISPARNVSLTKKGYTSTHYGWVILQNPTQVVIGYKITPESLTNTPVGTIAPQDAVPFFLKKTGAHQSDVTIEWIAIEQVKEYETDQILRLFDTASSTSVYSHKLGLLIKDSALGDVETLPFFIEPTPDVAKNEIQDGYKLEVFKNSTLVNSYLLKRGRYLLDLHLLDKTKPAEFMIKRPKCPSFLYPPTLQKGMKVIIKLDSIENKDSFADAVISEIYNGGGFCVEYTPEGVGGSTVNEKICLATMECGIEDEDWQRVEGNKEELEIRLFHSPSSQSHLTKTYIHAPPHLITKGSSEALELVDPEWKKNTLERFCTCTQSLTRPTVQEQIVIKHSRRLLKWLSFRDSSLPYSVILLPSNLDGATLKYPVAKTMFSEVSVHRLCFFQDGYIDMTKMPMVYPSKKYPRVRSLYDDVNIHAIAIHDGKDERTYPLTKPREVCLHMMDLPGFTVQKQIPVDVSYGCLYQGWTYIALLTHKLLLPAYTKIFNGELGDLDRQQIQSLLFQLIQPYASLCGIYSAQYGGLSNQENPTYLSDKIQDLCGGDSQPIPIELLGKGMIANNHTFVKFPPFLACKAHSHSRVDRNILRIPDLSLEAQYYKPYSEKMDILMINDQKLNSLPPTLFQIFENLQVLIIMDVGLAETPEFPSGIHQCNDLEIVCLSGLPGIKKISKDILSAPALTTVYLHNLPIRQLDIDWPASKTLTSLTLKGLLITEIPKEIAKLEELQELNLDCNPILDLPNELENLKKLKHLSARGIPWIAFEGKFDQMPKQIYKNWHVDNPYIVSYMSEQEVEELFSQFDENNNNILDASEVAKLNFEFLTRIPRIGVNKLGDTVHGGVPEVIFKLKALESLDLSYTGINCFPDLASELFTLQTLNLEHCPFLESVSGNLGLLPNIRSLHLNSCPLLETPPPDIVGRGFDSIRAFLKKMAGGFTECHRTKLMFIGLGQAGKTTLLQALQSPNKKTQGTQDAKLTDGIEIKPWIVHVKTDDKEFDITYSCWDFAGQTVYYNTHQFFLSKQAVYMLLWNMRMGFEHAGLDFWLSSVACHCPNAPVVIVGTQLDQIPMPDIPEKELMRKYPQIKKFCYVSSTAGTNVPDLEQTLIDVTLTCCSQMTLKIPKVWLNFEETILTERKRGINILEWKKLKEYAIDNGIYDDKDIRLAVQFLDDLGTVQYFDTEILRDRVVINPQWIVDVMAKVVSVNEKSIKENKGRFFHKFIKEIWSDYDPSLHEWMLKLTEQFDLTFPLPDSDEDVNVVPCLLPEEEPDDLPWPKIEEEAGIRESKIQYKFTYLPTGLFNRAQARLFSQGFTDNELLKFLWKKGSILKKNNHYALVKQISDYEMIVTVQGPRPKNILDLIHETISTLIKDSFQGVDYDFYIPCPDCVEKEGTRDPFLFKADLVSRAHNVNAPFLQCTKYFHTVSIGELMSIMPDNRETEFDVQIQESISTLQEISSNMAKDVAILYSPEDIPPKSMEGELVDPRQICTDLRMAGFNCYFPKDVNITPELEMTLAIKNAKVLVVCLSEKFVQHSKCHQMFLYAMEQLHKPFAIAVMDENLDGWKSTDIGFRIGNPRMAMIKNVKRYLKKIEDLIDIIRSHILDIEKNIVSYPLVFISYCWANSHIACNDTTEAKEGSLGFGDPRALKKHLENNGIHCWIDFEQMGKFGLYQDITIGLQNSKVLVVCVSDEYLQSDACMMEARFAAYNLMMPMVVCVVGTGKSWKMSEVSLMVQKLGDMCHVVKMQKESEDENLYDRALACVQEFLNKPESEKQKKVRESIKISQLAKGQMKKEELEKKLKQQGDTKFSFQEEIELIQRKFMRHILKITRADNLENELPKLLVFDFVKKDDFPNSTFRVRQKQEAAERESRMTETERPLTAQSLRARTKKKSQSRDKMKAVTLEELEDDWQGEDFCIRVLCEDEQGWHLTDQSLSLINRTSEEIYKALKDAAPYLARIYAILKQSAISLNCLTSKMGENFLNYIRKEGIGTKNFSDAYKVIHKLVAESEDLDEFIKPLTRCYLQSGKISWLCEKHQSKGGITQIQMGTTSIHGTARVLVFEEDTLLKELILASPLYLDRLKERTDFTNTREKSTAQTLKKKTSEVEKPKEEKKPITNGKEEIKEQKPTKKSEKSVRISDKPPPPSLETREDSANSVTARSDASSRSNKSKSMRRQKSQACSIQ